jgi:hypothetical protein
LNSSLAQNLPSMFYGCLFISISLNNCLPTQDIHIIISQAQPTSTVCTAVNNPVTLLMISYVVVALCIILFNAKFTYFVLCNNYVWSLLWVTLRTLHFCERNETHTAIILRIQVFCDVTLCHWVSGSSLLKELWYSSFQCSVPHTQQHSVAYQNTWIHIPFLFIMF